MDKTQKPFVISLCGTWLKPEMCSIYRQVIGLQRWRTAVLTERIHEEASENFPLPSSIPVEAMIHQGRTRPSGHFIKHFWYKRILKQWPPPKKIIKRKSPYQPYDLPQRLERLQPNLVHVYYGHKAIKYRRMLNETGIPWIVSFHGVDAIKGFERPNYDRKMREVFADAQLVLARSESLLERLKEIGCPEEKLRLNRTPVPLENIQSRIVSPPKDQRWILFQACRLIEKKGLLTTIEALREVCQAYPQLEFRIGGTGPLKDQLQSAIAQAGLSSQVKLLGWLSQEQMREEFAQAHAFLHPSEMSCKQDREGVPNAMLEAMAYGLPIIATYHGGIPEAVTHEKEGLLVPEKSPQELAKAIHRLLDEPQLLPKLSQEAAKSVRAKFSTQAGIQALENCYSEAITTRNA